MAKSSNMSADLIIIGAGASGLMAASQASKKKRVILLDSSDTPGKKLLLTGGGRCNVSNDSSLEEYLENIPRGGNFLRSSFSQFFHEDLRKFFHPTLSLMNEGRRLYPVSQKAEDVLRFFLSRLQDTQIHLNTKVTSLSKRDGKWQVKTTRGVFLADKVIVASGGKSLPKTGSDGSMFSILSKIGVDMVTPEPTLVSMFSNTPLKTLSGLTLPDVTLHADHLSHRGSLLFTHKGLSGPVVINMSSLLPRTFPLTLSIDFLPDMSEDDVQHILFQSKKSLSSQAQLLVPDRLAKCLFPESDDKHQWNKKRRRLAVLRLKAYEAQISSFAGFESAIVTRGGVALPQIHPSSLEHKTLKGLYFAGECLDVDALSGGYNLQIAWSTGFVSGQTKSIPRKKTT